MIVIKDVKLMFSFFLVLFAFSTSCEANNIQNIEEDTPFEQERENPHSIADLVLIYGGGAHRTNVWDADHFSPYTSYTDQKGQSNWLFDGFLFLEIVDGAGKIFATGYDGSPATKLEWTKLLEYYFRQDNAIDALNTSVSEIVGKIGAPSKIRKVVVGIPEPIAPKDIYSVPNDYWGEVKGRKLDFSKDMDRVEAVKWYIDQVIGLFERSKFRYVELAGFYWIAEETLHTKTILSEIATYLDEKTYSFNWIPYWKESPDYLLWKDLKFDYAYLQPNYFFNRNIPYARLTQACKIAKDYDLDLELEFDLRAMVDKGNWADRLYDYMNAFRENSVLETKRIAYYQDADALYQFSKASNQTDKQLYHDFCSFVMEHSKKYNK